MKNEYLTNIKEEDIQEGYIYLTNSYNGKKMKKQALNIPGYGWIPCAKSLINDYTTNPDELVIVHVEEGDDSYGLSDIWVARTTVIITTVELW